MKNPCKECLKLAICISQAHLTCWELAQYADHMYRELENDYWRYVSKYLPRLTNLYG